MMSIVKTLLPMTAAALLACVISSEATAAKKPALLFCGRLHNGYVTKPLHAKGFELDTCSAANMADKIDSGNYNVLVFDNLLPKHLQTVNAFLAKGGGVFVLNPHNYPDEETWTASNKWLAEIGARPRWERLMDRDGDNVAMAPLRVPLSWSTDVATQFADGVRGVWTHVNFNGTGPEQPMSFTLTNDWDVVVRGAKSMYTAPDTRKDPHIAPWLTEQGIESAPPLLAVRKVGRGRLAVVGIRWKWVLSPPHHCPPAEAMLTLGVDGRPSGWLQVFANVFRWLSEPSIEAGLGGFVTSDDLLYPKPKLVPIPEQKDWAVWSRSHPLSEAAMPQTAGLVGAKTALSGGSGSVADYVQAAKDAELDFIVFLEDTLQMNQQKWETLVAQCRASSDEMFLAVPGVTYEDAQGNHLYAFADEAKLPPDEMLLPDRRLATVQQIRSRTYFGYYNEYNRQKCIGGFWNHENNRLHYADYKLYNSFPIFTFADGRRVDSALDEYLYLQGIGGCQAVLALEMMTSPEQVAKRARDGWKVIAHRPLEQLGGSWFQRCYSFSGGSAQYITKGPQIILWEGPNRLAEPKGLWFRPDLWQYRLRLKVASEVGLKCVTIHDGDRQVMRRYLLDGEKEFAEEIIMSNSQQLAPLLIVEDVQGKRAISMSFWSRNLLKEEFMCSDRCNPLGNSRLVKKDRTGWAWTPVGFQNNLGVTASKGLLKIDLAPAVSLTPNSPTLPIDGKPAGFPTTTLRFNPRIPGEIEYLFQMPRVHVIGPEVGIGDAVLKYAFDPQEKGATHTRLGHEYITTDKRGKPAPQLGWGNAWGGWQHLVPTAKIDGFVRVHAWNWLIGGFRLGAVQGELTAKEDIEIPAEDPGIRIGRCGGDWQYFRGVEAIDLAEGASLPTSRGTFAALEHAGGSLVLVPLDGPLQLVAERGGGWSLWYAPADGTIEKGQTLRYMVGFAGAAGSMPGQFDGTPMSKLVKFAEDVGVAHPGRTAYRPVITRGEQLDNYFYWHLQADKGAVEVALPKVKLIALLSTVIEGLNDNWSVYMLDRNRDRPNFRALPIRDGRSYLDLDTEDNDMDLFFGHPVTADKHQVKITAAWMEQGKWSVEAHNPSDHLIHAHLKTNAGWTLFALDEQISLPPGSSKRWVVDDR
jgi:hypothetical protein